MNRIIRINRHKSQLEIIKTKIPSPVPSKPEESLPIGPSQPKRVLNPLANPAQHPSLIDTSIPPVPTESAWSQFVHNQTVRNQGLPLGLPLFYTGFVIWAYSCYREMNLPPDHPGRFPKLEDKTLIDGTAVTIITDNKSD